mgnify:CR=1 FL=1
MYDPETRYRSSRQKPFVMPRGIFAGNKSVKYGLFAVFACILVVEFYNRAGPVKLTGPIDDIFRRDPDRLVIVYGTGGEDDGSLRQYALKVSRLLGRNLSHEILVYPDVEVDQELIEDFSLMLYGPVNENLIARRLKDYLPFYFANSGVYLGDRFVAEDNWRMVFIVPNPYNTEHYILVYTGKTAADVVGINLVEHPNFTQHDTTDYVLTVGSQIVEQGYFDKSDEARWSLAR